MYGVYLVLALMLVGGVIALIGDRVGSKVGKKKLSLFGLRPRHTSMIVTVLTGILISTISLAMMSVVSKNVRTALFGMGKLQQEMMETQSLLQGTREKLAVVSEEYKTNQEQLQLNAQKLSEEEKRIHQMSLEREQLENKNDDLKKQNDVLFEVNQAFQKDNEELAQRAKGLREGLKHVREGELVFRAGEILSMGIIKHTSQETPKEQLDALIQKALKQIQQRRKANKNDNDDEFFWMYRPEYENCLKNIRESQQDQIIRIIAAGNFVKGEPIGIAFQHFDNKTIYQKNQFIIARPFQLEFSQTTENRNDIAKNILIQFLKYVNETATANGILPDPISGSVGVMDGNQFYSIVQAISKANGNIILSAYAQDNTDASDPLRLTIKLETFEDEQNYQSFSR